MTPHPELLTTTPERLIVGEAQFPSDLEHIRQLLTSYTTWLDLDLEFQGFEEELSSLPGKYSLQLGGCLLLARRLNLENRVTIGDNGGSVSTSLSLCDRGNSASITGIESQQMVPSAHCYSTIGMVCLRRFFHLDYPAACELKRLFVDPSGRGMGAGPRLVEEAIRQARAMGYKNMLLDTLPRMIEAKGMYKRYGFEEIEHYYSSPLGGTAFMRLRL